jgi:transcriptional regulator with XRE-family HTH domain
MTVELSEDLLATLEGREWARSGRGARIRRNAGVTQTQLATEIGVNQMTISRWERGERTPRNAEAARYARALRALGEL